MTVITNRVVTRGFGPSRGLPGRAGPVTQGFGGPPTFVPAALRRATTGRSGKRPLDDLEEVIVWARLVEVNGRPPETKIEGSVRVKVNRAQGIAVLAEHVRTRVQDAIKVVAKLVRRP